MPATSRPQPSRHPARPPPSPGLAALRAIVALMLREMSTQYGRTPGGYLWVVVRPMLVIAVLATGFSLLQPNPALGTSFLLFKATGYLILLQFQSDARTVGHALPYSRQLLECPGVVWIDAILARFVLNTLIALVVTLLVLAGILAWEGLVPVVRWPLLVQALGLTLMLAAGVGCLNAVLFLRFEVWQHAWAILTAPLFIASGVILLYEDMPRLAQEVLWWNPLLHLTGLMRAGFYPAYNPSYFSMAYVCAWGLITLFLGLVTLRRWHRVLLER